MPRPDYARIRELEAWHTAWDCESDGGHVYPDEHVPSPPESFEVVSWGGGVVRTVTAAGPPCAHCGTPLAA